RRLVAAQLQLARHRRQLDPNVDAGLKRTLGSPAGRAAVRAARGQLVVEPFDWRVALRLVWTVLIDLVGTLARPVLVLVWVLLTLPLRKWVRPAPLTRDDPLGAQVHDAL